MREHLGKEQIQLISNITDAFLKEYATDFTKLFFTVDNLFLSNIVLFRAINVGETLPFYHETDCLVCSKAGYLKEIEIKRSWADFLADFRKDHRHEGEGCINQFYYCIPVSITDKVKEKLQIENIEYAGIITYDENLNMRVEVEARKLGAKKLSIDQRLHLARLGTIRAISLMKKIVKLQIQTK